MTAFCATFWLDRGSGQIFPIAPTGNPSDGLIQIASPNAPNDPGAILAALNRAGAVLAPIVGKYTASWSALATAAATGNRIVLTPA